MTRSFELIIRILCVSWGALMLLTGATDALAPRARYVRSTPEPGATPAAVPPVITIRFSRELLPDSTLAVVSTVSRQPSGEMLYTGGEDVVAEAGLDPNDSSCRTLRAVLRPGLGDGLYRVDWRTVATRARSERWGMFYFGVGMPVPDHIRAEMGGALRERNPDPIPEVKVSRNTILLAGMLLIAVGILLPPARKAIIGSRWSVPRA